MVDDEGLPSCKIQGSQKSCREPHVPFRVELLSGARNASREERTHRDSRLDGVDRRCGVTSSAEALATGAS